MCAMRARKKCRAPRPGASAGREIQDQCHGSARSRRLESRSPAGLTRSLRALSARRRSAAFLILLRPPGQQRVSLSPRAQSLALGGGKPVVFRQGLRAHEISRFCAVLAAVGEHVHQLVSERERQVTRAISGTAAALRATAARRPRARPRTARAMVSSPARPPRFRRSASAYPETRRGADATHASRPPARLGRRSGWGALRRRGRHRPQSPGMRGRRQQGVNGGGRTSAMARAYRGDQRTWRASINSRSARGRQPRSRSDHADSRRCHSTPSQIMASPNPDSANGKSRLSLNTR